MTINRMKLGDTTIRNVRRRIVTFAGLQMGKNTSRNSNDGGGWDNERDLQGNGDA